MRSPTKKPASPVCITRDTATTPKTDTNEQNTKSIKCTTKKTNKENKCRMSTAARRNDRLMRVMRRLLRPCPEALAMFSDAVKRGELNKVVGKRDINGAPRKRTVFVMYTSRAVEDVRRENPEMQSNDVFREVARRWREEIKPNPKKYNIYKALADEHNNRVAANC